jgi:hypothetical protein
MEHVTSRLLSSAVLQLQDAGHPPSPSPTALHSATKISSVIIAGHRYPNGNCWLVVTIWGSFVGICKGVSIKQLNYFYIKFRIILIFQTNVILESPEKYTLLPRKYLTDNMIYLKI